MKICDDHNSQINLRAKQKYEVLSVTPLIACNIWRRTEKSGVKLSNVERKSVKPEESQELSCTGKLEKALPHQSLPPPFPVLTAEDSSAHRLVPLAICTLVDAFLNYKVDQIVLIDYDGQRRSRNLIKRTS